MPPKYKPPMSLMTFGVVFGLFVVGAFGFVLVYAPPISGAYYGVAQDVPSGASGSIILILAETDGLLAGDLTLPSVMGQGGGALVGRMKNGRIFFVTTDGAGHKMTWVALVGHKSMSGDYWWGEIDEAALNGVARLGMWKASLRR